MPFVSGRQIYSPEVPVGGSGGRERKQCFKPPTFAAAVVAGMCAGCALIARADEPLSLERLIAQPGEWHVTGGVTYVNSQDNGNEFGDQSLSETNTNVDTVLPMLGVKYGLASGLQIYAQATGYWTSMRTTTENEESATNRTNSGFLGLALGMNKKFSERGGVGAVYGFAQVALDQNTISVGDEQDGGAVWSLGVTAFRIMDPISLGIGAALTTASERDSGQGRVQPGNAVSVSPGINFAVNADITLVSNLNWFWADRDEIDGKKVGIVRTGTSLGFGLLHAWSDRFVVNFDVSANISGAPTAQMGCAASYRL